MSAVVLHVYDVTNSTDAKTNENILTINRIFKDNLAIGGIFHGAVEVYGQEWSFGYCPQGTGVFACAPKENPMYKFRETVVLPPTCKDEAEVKRILKELKSQWPGNGYDLLKRNCNHFCNELCERLEVGPIPFWVNRFATMGDASVEMYINLSNQMEQAGNAMRATSQKMYTYFFGNPSPVPSSGPAAAGSSSIPRATSTSQKENDPSANGENSQLPGIALPSYMQKN